MVLKKKGAIIASLIVLLIILASVPIYAVTSEWWQNRTIECVPCHRELNRLIAIGELPIHATIPMDGQTREVFLISDNVEDLINELRYHRPWECELHLAMSAHLLMGYYDPLD